MKMGFGKHADQEVADVPDKYLRWVLRECQNVEPDLYRAIRDHLKIPTPADGHAHEAVAVLASRMAYELLGDLDKWRDKARACIQFDYAAEPTALKSIDNICVAVTRVLDSVAKSAREAREQAIGLDDSINGEQPAA